ncbi:hypothetical protein ACQPTN_18545 [Bradyrhizobium sp. 13971]
MSVQADLDFASDDRARAQIGAAVSYLLRDATGVSARACRRDDCRDGARHRKPAAHCRSGIDSAAHERRHLSGFCDRCLPARRRSLARDHPPFERQEIRIASPPSVRDEATTTADAITAEKAIEFARRAIDLGEVI